MDGIEADHLAKRAKTDDQSWIEANHEDLMDVYDTPKDGPKDTVQSEESANVQGRVPENKMELNGDSQLPNVPEGIPGLGMLPIKTEEENLSNPRQDAPQSAGLVLNEDAPTGASEALISTEDMPNKDIERANQSVVEAAEVMERNGTTTGEARPSGKPQKVKLDEEFLKAAEQNKSNAGAEWQLDSSDAESSSDDTSSSSDSDSSDDSDSDEADDYKLLDPEEQARILMSGEGGSDDEGGGNKGGKAAASVRIRSKNEVADEKVVKPDVTVTPEMKIEELGAVEAIVENDLVIKAKVSGEYRVLESGSVLCLEDRSVLGAVAETLGRVQQPFYSVRIGSLQDLADAGISIGTKTFYVEQHSSYVLTGPLQSIKGSDASNLHDEEIGDEEMEFSDDEAEAEHKRRIKLERQSKRDARQGGRGGRLSGPVSGQSAPIPEEALNYDDGPGNGGEELYTPLSRPAKYKDMVSNGRPTEGPDRGRGKNRGRGRGRGRGQHGFQAQNGGSHQPYPSQHNSQHPQHPNISPHYSSYNQQYPPQQSFGPNMPPPQQVWPHHPPQYGQVPAGFPSHPPTQPHFSTMASPGGDIPMSTAYADQARWQQAQQGHPPWGSSPGQAGEAQHSAWGSQRLATNNANQDPNAAFRAAQETIDLLRKLDSPR